MVSLISLHLGMRSPEQINAEMTLVRKRYTEHITALQEEMLQSVQGLVTSGTVAQGTAEKKREISLEKKSQLLALLEQRLGSKPDHYQRPKGINFADVQRALEAEPAALWSLWHMQESGGEPDIVSVENDAFLFADCSAESPAGRRNCVFDKEAEESASPAFNGNAVDMAAEYGVDIWSSDFYKTMQKEGKFDSKTWSWHATDAGTRSSGFALYGSRLGVHVRVVRGSASVHYERGAWRGLRWVKKA